MPHQLRALSGQVGEVLLCFDLHRSPGRFSANWERGKPELEALMQQARREHPNVRVAVVDYSPHALREVSQRFFAGADYPLKDSRGGPYHSYFFALAAAKFDHVLHLDADMLLGGNSKTWVAEAAALFESRPELLSVSPLPGPPTFDGSLRFSPRHGLTPEPGLSNAFRFHQWSTRIFLIDRRRLPPLKPRLAPPALLLRALVRGHPPYREPENLVTRLMKRLGLYRLDWLGSGLWSLHPNFRTDAFFSSLPALIERIERGDMPEFQRGLEELQPQMWVS